MSIINARGDRILKGLKLFQPGERRTKDNFIKNLRAAVSTADGIAQYVKKIKPDEAEELANNPTSVKSMAIRVKYSIPMDEIEEAREFIESYDEGMAEFKSLGSSNFQISERFLERMGPKPEEDEDDHDPEPEPYENIPTPVARTSNIPVPVDRPRRPPSVMPDMPAQAVDALRSAEASPARSASNTLGSVLRAIASPFTQPAGDIFPDVQSSHTSGEVFTDHDDNHPPNIVRQDLTTIPDRPTPVSAPTVPQQTSQASTASIVQAIRAGTMPDMSEQKIRELMLSDPTIAPELLSMLRQQLITGNLSKNDYEDRKRLINNLRLSTSMAGNIMVDNSRAKTFKPRKITLV